jgi:hypothetical protein
MGRLHEKQATGRLLGEFAMVRLPGRDVVGGRLPPYP